MCVCPGIEADPAAAAAAHLICLVSLRKVYKGVLDSLPFVAVRGVSLGISKGECFGYVGKRLGWQKQNFYLQKLLFLNCKIKVKQRLL